MLLFMVRRFFCCCFFFQCGWSTELSQTRRWSRLKPNCYGWRGQQKQLGKNRGIIKHSWAFVETNRIPYSKQPSVQSPPRLETIKAVKLTKHQMYDNEAVEETLGNTIQTYLLRTSLQSRVQNQGSTSNFSLNL